MPAIRKKTLAQQRNKASPFGDKTKSKTNNFSKPTNFMTLNTTGVSSAMPTNEESQGFFSIQNTSKYANSLTQQVQTILGPLPGEEIPKVFEQFSQEPLEVQLSIVAPKSLSGGGQKGGALLDDTYKVILGAVKVHIEPLWQAVLTQSEKTKKTTRSTFINYITKVRERLGGAGLDGEEAQANLKSVLYGLGVLVMAYNTGIFHYLPELRRPFMKLMSYVAYQMADLILPAIGAVSVAREAALTVYRYRDLPYGAYGVYAAVSNPFFSSAYMVADAEIQTINPGIGQAVTDQLKDQIKAWQATMRVYKDIARTKFNKFRKNLEPLKLLISALITGFDKSLSDSIETLVNGMEVLTRDVDKRMAYLKFLRDVGAGVRDFAEQPELQAALAVSDNEQYIGALTLGVGLANINSIDADNPTVPIAAPSENDVMDAAAGLLALVDNAAPIATERLIQVANQAAGVPASTWHESEIRKGDLAAAAAESAATAAPHPDEMGGGKPRRRRHRKTAKKSHKKKHTKKHKRKTTKTKKGKKAHKGKDTLSDALKNIIIYCVIYK